ncbi:MAG: amidophosphoribosyltransferase [Candidatus Bathyarchaeia archaeon]
MIDSLKIACGVFGAVDFSHNPIFPTIYWGLRAQNHRGHQSHGFLTFDGKFHAHKGLDLVPKIKKRDIQDWLDRLPGHLGIANVRYTTSGGVDEQALIRGTQPVVAESGETKFALSFNGNVVNAVQLKREICEVFPDFAYECDAELICRKLLIEYMKTHDIKLSVKACMKEIEGAFSVAGINQDGEFFIFKDPHGIRPLCCGYSQNRKIYAASSESVGLNINSLEHAFEVVPGEFITVSEDGFHRERLVSGERKAFCGFEFAYFARPDSKFDDKYVYEVREEFGRNLAREYSDIVRSTDIIVSMPETGDDAAFGLHMETGIRWERALRRHRYVTERAFILLPQERYTTIDRKINVLESKIKGKNLAVVEDSIVRGDTTKVIVEKLRKMGAKKVHLFITFPRIIGPCPYGIDMATYSELIGSTHEADEIAEIIGADSVNYQSLDGFIRATGMREDELCLACVTGKYPTPLAQKMADEMRQLFEKGYKETGRLYEMFSIIEKPQS